ncbi:glycosyltransferase [Romboutsia weinsteinii]|uniref:Glycosyltransferase n=1 Tax=Romboutsia weinsteinii TaxID=2020949 RepID=A0A371IYU7_9FIRM|nr:bifunctional glycosyltransferase family 2 protein/class I SAM-dependent methyltransferase [Romboutsia weinsteinii]RDY25649.1 glycosyltransferase [Romboutsia weinsteinii]
MNGEISLNKETYQFIQEYDYNTSEEINFTSIIILTYNKLEYTKLCIESIRKFTPKNKYEIIVVDNNSSDDTVSWLKEQEDIISICNDTNVGFPAGCNQGIKIAKGDSVLLLNNDVIVTPNWLNNLDKALYSKDDIGAVGAITNNCSNAQQIEVSYTDISQMIDFASKVNISNEQLWDYKITLVGFCYLIKKEVLDKVGFLDERFTPGNYEDNDLSFRIIVEGYKLLLCKDCFVHHFGSVSFKENMDSFINNMNTNFVKMNEKWGFNIRYSAYPRLDIVEKIQEDKDKKMNVLDIGCGAGATLLEIKSRFRNADIYGIEVCEPPTKIGKSFANVICGSVEEIELPYEEGFFDYIILADVLEHLKDPWEVLRNIKKYLKKTGHIIASIPNLMHVTELRNLINGSFTYSEAGILDRTHLRFFTLLEIQRLFLSTEYNIDELGTIAIVISKEEEEFINKLCSLSNESLRTQYYIYQYLVKVSPVVSFSEYIDSYNEDK